MIQRWFPMRKLIKTRSRRLRIAAGWSAGRESRISGSTTRLGLRNRLGTVSMMHLMNVIGKKLSRLPCWWLLLVALLTGGCSLKERLPSLPEMPKIPTMGKKEPSLPAYVGPAGSGSYLFYKQCAACHDDPPAASFAEMMKNVPTITDPRRVKQMDQTWLYRIISEGGSGVGRRSAMPSFKDVLTEGEMRRIVSYLNGNPV